MSEAGPHPRRSTRSLLWEKDRALRFASTHLSVLVPIGLLGKEGRRISAPARRDRGASRPTTPSRTGLVDSSESRLLQTNVRARAHAKAERADRGFRQKSPARGLGLPAAVLPSLPRAQAV